MEKKQNLRGHFEACDNESIRGWIIDNNNPNIPVEINIFMGNKVIAHGLANEFRPDLEKANIGNGCCSFCIAMPSLMFDGLEHEIEVREKNSGWVLPHKKTIKFEPKQGKISPESQLIPYAVTKDFPEKSFLIFAPHPDDETFGMGGTILKLTKNHQTVNIVLMTDGALGGERETRIAEFLKATELLGCKENTFFNAPDRGLQVNVESIKKVIDLLNQYKPDNVFFPSPLEYHPDHRATAWLVWNAIQSIDFKVNCFSYEISNQSLANVLVDITDVIDDKIRIMQLYTSQLMQNDYVAKITALNRSRSYTLAKEVLFAEAFFQFTNKSFDFTSHFYNHFNKFQQGFLSENCPLVSILIRTKNRPELLKNALASVKKQTYQQFEVNIVNDGGKNIQHIVDMFEFERSAVKNHEISKGRAAAANALLDMICGKYAIFLDDDDTFDSNHIENLVKVINQNENMLVYYSGIRVGNNLENKPNYNSPYNAALLRRGNYIPIHAVLFSKKILELGCHFDETFQIYEDWDFWLQLAQHTDFYYTNQITATYNINGDSGAGESHYKRDNQEETWKLKIYEKWSKIWAPLQLSQTFQTLATIDTVKIQNEINKNKTLTEEINGLLREKEKMQSELRSVTTVKNQLDAHINSLLKERVLINTEHNSKQRDFVLASARNYETECMALFEEVFKQPMTTQFWRWKYKEVQWRGICAIKNGKVIAYYNGMPRNIMFFGEHKRALQACDIMVSLKARGGIKINSPFYNVAKIWGLTNLGIEKDFLLSYGFPNKRYMSLAEKVGLYVEVDMIMEVHWNTVHIKNMPKAIVEEYTLDLKLDTQVNRLWENMAKDFKEDIIGIRNANHLISRYLQHPVTKYNIYLVRDEKQELLAVFVLKKENKHMLLIDVIATKEHFKTAIEQACHITKDSECDLQKCWITKSKSHFFDCCDSTIKETDVRIPTSNITDGFDPEMIKNKWFLMYGDTDFI